jgi:hypothetical protein
MSHRVVVPFMIGVLALALLVGPVVSVSAAADAGVRGINGCSSRNVKITLGPTFGATGTSIQVIVFGNTGSSTCFFAGNPEVGFTPSLGPAPSMTPYPW